MLDRLNGLRHHAVVGRHHQNDDIRDRRAARTHGGKCGMARGVDERQLLVAGLCLVGPDMLGNSAGLTIDDLEAGIANRVQEGCLAMIHVPHHRDDRRATRDCTLLFGFLALPRNFPGIEECFFLEPDVLNFKTVFGRQAPAGLNVDGLIDGNHDTHGHQLALDGR